MEFLCGQITIIKYKNLGPQLAKITLYEAEVTSLNLPPLSYADISKKKKKNTRTLEFIIYYSFFFSLKT
jgi:hypothetical protein